MALPTVPPGQNPWAVYLDTLEGMMYPKLRDAHGFSTRAYILMGVCAYGILIPLVYGAVVARRVRRQGKSFWVAKKVDGYLVLNLAFFVPCGGAISCAFMLSYTALQHRLFTLSVHPYHAIYSTNAFRSFCWFPLVLHGYCLTAAAAQACLVVCSRTAAAESIPTQRGRDLRSFARGAHLPRPAIINGVFWAGLAVLVLGLLLTDILFTISWTRFYTQIAAFERFLVAQRTLWVSATATPTSGAQLLDLLSHFNAATAADGRNHGYQRAVVYALIVAPALLALVTASAGLLLHVLLRRQIRARRARRALGLASPFALPELAEIPSGPSCASAESGLEAAGTTHTPEFVLTLASSAGAHSPPASPALAAAKQERPTSSRSARCLSLTGGARGFALGLPKVKCIRPTSAESHKPFEGLVAGAGADEKHEGGGHAAGWEEGARVEDGNDEALAELRRAQRDLGVCTGAVLLLTLAFTAENLWNVIAVIPLAYTELSWAIIEASFFLPPWMYATVYSAGPTGLLLFSLFSWEPSPPGPPSAARRPSIAHSAPRISLPAFLQRVKPRTRSGGGEAKTAMSVQERRRSGIPVVISQSMERSVEEVV